MAGGRGLARGPAVSSLYEPRARPRCRRPARRLARPLRDPRRGAAVRRRQLARAPTRGDRARLAELQDAWASRLVGGWDDWLDLPLRVGDLLAEHVLGARPGEVVCCDSVTVNLYKLATAALDVCPGAIVACAADFPTDRYVLAGRGGAGWPRVRRGGRADGRGGRGRGRRGGRGRARLAVARRLPDRRADRPRCRACGRPRARRADAVGSLALGRRGRDRPRRPCRPRRRLHLQVPRRWPGRAAYLYVREGLQEQLRSPIQGWFGQVDQFGDGPGL